MGIDILGIDIMGVDILGMDILALPWICPSLSVGRVHFHF